MSQADTRNTISVSDIDSGISCDQITKSCHPDAELLAAWPAREQALAVYYAADEEGDEVFIEEVRRFEKIITNNFAKTTEGLSIQIRYLLSPQVREFYMGGDIERFLCGFLGHIDKLISHGKMQILHSDIDEARNLDCAIADMEAGIGVLTGLADSYCASGENVSSESVVWLAAKLSDDVRRLSATVDAYQSAARR